MVSFISQNDRQVTADDDMFALLFDFGYKPAKIRVHFGRTAGQVNSFDGGNGQHIQTKLHHLARHDLFSVRPGIYMAVFANLVTHFAHVDLENINPCLPATGTCPKLLPYL